MTFATLQRKVRRDSSGGDHEKRVRAPKPAHAAAAKHAPASTAAHVASPFSLGGVQRAVKVGAAGDAAEHEADRAADHVVSGPAQAQPTISRIESLQRQVNRIREQAPPEEGAVHRSEAQPAENAQRAGTEEGTPHRTEAEVRTAPQSGENAQRTGTEEGTVHRSEAEVQTAPQSGENAQRTGTEEGTVHRSEAEVHKSHQSAETTQRAEQKTAETPVTAQRTSCSVQQERPSGTASIYRKVKGESQAGYCPEKERPSGTASIYRKVKGEAESGEVTQGTGLPAERERPSGTASIYRKAKGEGESAETAQRKAASDMDAAATHAVATKGTGEPLRPQIRHLLEKRMGVDLSGVRVHEGPAAHQAAAAINARAFAHKSDIWLGRGESQENVRLMAHEVTHVVQQGSAPRRTPMAQRRSQEEPVRREPVPVQETVTSPRVQRFGLNPLDYIADHANLIPGFRMFTIILGVNPINMSPVERSAANVMRAVVEFIPGGGLITKALDTYGVFDKVGTWVDQQLATLNLVGSSIKQALTDFIKSLGLTDLGDLGGAWDRAKRIFTEPIDRIKSFVAGLAEGIIKFIKDAILMPLAKLAEGTRGWDLLIAVLGKNPITGEAVPRTAETLIGGFMKLIGQEEVWENLKKANAVARAWAWFQSALSSLLGFVSQLPDLFIQAVKSLQLEDIVIITQAFSKVAGVFGKFIGDFLKWAGDAVWELLQIIFEVVAPAVIPYLKKLGAAFKTVLKNPMAFVGNLVKAAKLGFQQFAGNIGTHLKTSFIEWLTGSLQGVYIPKSLEFKEIVAFVLSVLGLTWQNIRQKLVKVLSEPVVKAMETGFEIVVTLVKEGPAAAWEKIKEQLGALKDMVMQGIMDFVVETVVKKAIAKILSLLVPGGAFIQAIISIYDTIMVFVDKLSKIAQVVKAFLDSLMDIASGAIGGAANKVESTLAGLLTLAINFLAGFLGLGKIADKVMNIINTKVRQPIDKALDKVIDWIVTMAKKLFSKVFGKKDKPDERTDEQKKADLDKAISEAQTLQDNQQITDEQVTKGLAAIKQKYNMVSLELTVDSDDESQESVHVEGKINPNKPTKESKRNSKDPVVKEFTIPRPSFETETLEELKEDYPQAHKVALGASGNPLVKKGQARRHIVSSKDMAVHYENTLKKPTKWSEAKNLLEKKGNVALARTPVANPLNNTTIRDAAIERHSKFFNWTKNLFMGDSWRNSQIGQDIDKEKPGMGPIKLDKHIKDVKRKWALNASFEPSGLDD